MESAERLYQQMTQRGLLSTVREWLGGQPSRLLTLGEVVDDATALEGRPLGLQQVSVTQIVGSVEASRSQDFDAAFRPRNSHLKQRWLRVAMSRQRGTSRRLPPVELVQLGERYFVVDGHHRVSVERALGGKAVEANVTDLTPRDRVEASSFQMMAAIDDLSVSHRRSLDGGVG